MCCLLVHKVRAIGSFLVLPISGLVAMAGSAVVNRASFANDSYTGTFGTVNSDIVFINSNLILNKNWDIE